MTSTLVTDRQRPQALRRLEHVMGTVVTLDLYSDAGAPGPDFALGLAEARAVLRRADAVFSTWKEHSPMSRLRRGEISGEDAPPEMVEVLELCALAHQVSDGWFDPWAMPGGVDPTGYVKGWAAQRALAALHVDGVRGAMVNAAGDIASFGRPDPSTSFRVGIVDPFSPGQLACVAELRGAMATSGTYERGGHLIDPRTRRPTARAASATVCGPDLGLADALATALAVAGNPGLTMLQDLDGYDGLIISFDGSWRWTDGFPFASSVSPVGPLPATGRR